MKKLYVTPFTEDMVVEAGGLICASIRNGGSALDNGIDVAEGRMSEESIIEQILGNSNTINNLLGL